MDLNPHAISATGQTSALCIKTWRRRTELERRNENAGLFPKFADPKASHVVFLKVTPVPPNLRPMRTITAVSFDHIWAPIRRSRLHRHRPPGLCHQFHHAAAGIKRHRKGDIRPRIHKSSPRRNERSYAELRGHPREPAGERAVRLCGRRVLPAPKGRQKQKDRRSDGGTSSS